MKQMAIVVLLLITTLLMVQPVAAGQGSPDASVSLRITTSTSRGNPGDQVTVSGSGAVPNQIVLVSLSPQANSAVGALISTEVTSAGDGTFSVVLTIPGDVPDGIYAVRAEQLSANEDVLHYYWNTFTVGSGGKGPFLPASGGEVKSRLSKVPIILGLVVVALMLSKGIYCAGKGLFIGVKGRG